MSSHNKGESLWTFSLTPQPQEKDDFENFLHHRPINHTPQQNKKRDNQIKEWQTDSKITFSFGDPNNRTPDIDTATEFREYLKAFPNARLQLEHPGTSEAFIETVKMLISSNSLASSIGLKNLISAILDERYLGNLEFTPQLEKGEQAAYKGVKPDRDPTDDLKLQYQQLKNTIRNTESPDPQSTVEDIPTLDPDPEDNKPPPSNRLYKSRPK